MKTQKKRTGKKLVLTTEVLRHISGGSSDATIIYPVPTTPFTDCAEECNPNYITHTLV